MVVHTHTHTHTIAHAYYTNRNPYTHALAYCLPIYSTHNTNQSDISKFIWGITDKSYFSLNSGSVRIQQNSHVWQERLKEITRVYTVCVMWMCNLTTKIERCLVICPQFQRDHTKAKAWFCLVRGVSTGLSCHIFWNRIWHVTDTDISRMSCSVPDILCPHNPPGAQMILVYWLSVSLRRKPHTHTHIHTDTHTHTPMHRQEILTSVGIFTHSKISKSQFDMARPSPSAQAISLGEPKICFHSCKFSKRNNTSSLRYHVYNTLPTCTLLHCTLCK